MDADVRIGYLADHPEVLPVLRTWFRTEWPEYYGPSGPGNAEQDLIAYSGREALPIGLVAFLEGQLCGVAVLKRDSLLTHAHLSPWATAGLVAPSYRRRGIGARLLTTLEDVAMDRGHSVIHCGTRTAVSLLTRNGWELIERAEIDGEDVSIFRKALVRPAP